MSEWIESKIDALTTDIIDCVNKTAPKVPYETPYKMIRTTNVKDGRLDVSEVNFVEESVFKKWTRRGLLEKNDILLTREAPLGEVARITNEKNYFLGQRLMMYRPDPQKVDPDFLFYAMLGREVKHQIKAFGMGSTVEHMRVPDCSEIVIKHPKDKEEQSIIGKTLSNLDQKITLLRQQNRDLEELAQTLFKRWFVDFEFPNDNGEPYKSSGGKMVESELGEIPEGWRVGKLREIAFRNPREIVKNGKEAPYIEMKDLSTSGMAISKTTLRNFSSGSKFRNGDTLLARITPCLENGKTGFVDVLENDKVGWGSTEFIVVRGKNVSPEFIYCLCRDKEFRNHSIKNMVGSSGRMRIPNDVVENYALPICANSVYNMFKEFINPLFSKSKRNRQEIQTLTQLRDTLLPKLMSGELKLTSDEKDKAVH